MSDEEESNQNDKYGIEFADSEDGVFGKPHGANAKGGGDYSEWDWKHVEAAIKGGAAVADDSANLVTIVDPHTLRVAAAYFDHAQQTMDMVATSLREHAEALAGEHGAWQGPAAKTFLAKMKTFARHLEENAERIRSGDGRAGGGGGRSVLHDPASAPGALYRDGEWLAWAQERITYLDDYYGRLALARGVTKMDNGLIPVSQDKEVVEAFNVEARKLIKQLADTYSSSLDHINVEPVNVKPIDPPGPPGPPAPPKPDVPDVPKPDVPDVPDPNVPKPDVPGPDVPGPEVPGGDGPNTRIPAPDVPGPDVPGANVPPPGGPGAAGPGADVLGANVPGPEVPGPDGSNTRIPVPDVPGPDVPGPDVPGLAGPGTDIPGASVPGPHVPEPNLSGTNPPGTDSPGVPPVAPPVRTPPPPSVPPPTAPSRKPSTASPGTVPPPSVPPPPRAPDGSKLGGGPPSLNAPGAGEVDSPGGIGSPPSIEPPPGLQDPADGAIGDPNGAQTGDRDEHGAVPPMAPPMVPPVSPPAGGGAGGGERSDASGLLDAGEEPWTGIGSGPSVGDPDAPGGAVPGGRGLDVPGVEVPTGEDQVLEGGSSTGVPPMAPPMVPPVSPPAGGGAGGGERSDASGLLDAGEEPWTVVGSGPSVGDPDAPGGAAPGGRGLDVPGVEVPTGVDQVLEGGSSTGVPPMAPPMVPPVSPPAGGGAGGGERSDASGLLDADEEPWTGATAVSGEPTAPEGTAPGGAALQTPTAERSTEASQDSPASVPLTQEWPPSPQNDGAHPPVPPPLVTSAVSDAAGPAAAGTRGPGDRSRPEEESTGSPLVRDVPLRQQQSAASSGLGGDTGIRDVPRRQEDHVAIVQPVEVKDTRSWDVPEGGVPWLVPFAVRTDGADDKRDRGNPDHTLRDSTPWQDATLVTWRRATLGEAEKQPVAADRGGLVRCGGPDYTDEERAALKAAREAEAAAAAQADDEKDDDNNDNGERSSSDLLVRDDSAWGGGRAAPPSGGIG